MRLPRFWTPLVMLSAAAGLAQAQQPMPGVRMTAPPPAAPAANPAVEEAQRAFDALPEAARRALQEDLIWGSTFTATVSGSFGPRTYDAIRKFQADMKMRPDGILSEDARKLLRDVAARARATAKYALVTDPRTGARLGIPAALLSRSEPAPGGSRWLSADGAVMLETAVAQGGLSELPGAFERVLAIPGRKVTYKLLREDFFVVAGESGPRSFYTRYGLGPNNLRGYTLSYPTPRARELERTVIALANSFQPIPGVTPAVAGGSQPGPGAGPATPPVQPPPAANTLPPGLIATGVVVAPGKVATAGAVAACPELRLRNQPARIARSAGGLTLLDADTGNLRPLAAAAATPAEAREGALVVLGFVSAGRNPALTVSSGALSGPADGTRPPRIEAPLHREAAGSLVFTRSAGLVGAIAAPRSAPRLVAGIVPAASHALVEARLLLAEAPTRPAAVRGPHSAGAIAAEFGPSLVAIDCAVPVPRD